MPRDRTEGLSRRDQFGTFRVKELNLALNVRALCPVAKNAASFLLNIRRALLIAFGWAFRSGPILSAFLASTILPISAHLGLEGGAAGNLGTTSTRLWAT